MADMRTWIRDRLFPEYRQMAKRVGRLESRLTLLIGQVDPEKDGIVGTLVDQVEDLQARVSEFDCGKERLG